MKDKPFLDFGGKTIVVSGASSGIGRAVSIELSKNNANLILIGRDNERLAETAAALGSGNHQTAELDLTKFEEIVSRMKELANQDRLYGLCHCAGVVETRPLSSFKVENLKSMMDINVIAGMELARAICRQDLMEPTGGSILFISSIYSIVGMAGQIGYSASKGAVTSMARAMAMELARRRIRVNVISPGLVRTQMIEQSFSRLNEKQIQQIESSFPLGTGTPEDVARAAAFLLAPQSRWITGIDMVLDGGYTAQ